MPTGAALPAAQRPDAAFCDAKTRRGGLCKRGAGWGTMHPGRGRCRLHGGSTPTHVKRYAREEAYAFARDALLADHDVDPLDVALANVRFGYGLVAFHRLKIEALDTVTAADVEELDRALLTSQRLTDVALRAGVAERLVKVAERYGEQIAAVCEAGLAALVQAGVQLTAQQRTAYASGVQSALMRVEATEPKALPPGQPEA